MSFDSSIKRFIEKPQDYFVCQKNGKLCVEEKGYRLKKWVYSVCGSKQYDLDTISKMVKLAVQDPEQTILDETEKKTLVSNMNEKIATHNTRAEAVS